jgi:hypothetical protein
MTKQQLIFADRLESAGVSGGVVRLNFSVEVPGVAPTSPDEVKYEHSTQVVMPLAGFGLSFQVLENLVRQVKEGNRPKEAEGAEQKTKQEAEVIEPPEAKHKMQNT